METTSDTRSLRRFRIAPTVSRLVVAAVLLGLCVMSTAFAGDVPVATVPVGDSPAVVAVNPLSHKVYVGNYYGDTVTVIDGLSHGVLATVPMPKGASIAVPITAVIDVLSGKAYIGTFWSNYVSVIDGSNQSIVATISPPFAHGAGVRALAADPTGVTPKVYATVYGKNVVSVIDASTDTIVKDIPVGATPRAIAAFASGARRRVYVANRNSDNVSIIDGNTDSVVATVPTGAGPKVIAVDPDRGFAYVSSPTSDTVTVIDDSDEVTATISVGDNPVGIGVDTAGRRVFVANNVANTVSVIDADTLSVVATVATGVQPTAVAVDRSSRKAYVTCYGSDVVTVIDSSLVATSVPTGYRPYALAVDEALASHQVYSANWGADTVTVIDPPGGDAGPVAVAIDPLSGDATSSASPTFSGTASSSRTPLPSDIVAVFCQVDAETGWHRAQIVSGAGSPSVRWQATVPGPLSAAPHVIRVAAMDQALAVSSSSDQGAGGDSAGLGGTSMYAFTVGTPAPTLVDAGFESGAEGTALVSPPWAANGAPQHREYDAARARTGSQSAWIQGPVTASNAGAYETASAGLSANGAETTFWLYLDTTSQSRLLDDYAPGVAGADRALGIQFASGGRVNVLTDHAGNPNGYTTGAYTTVGSYESGWTQYRIVYTFTGAGAQTYTLSKRSSEADPWTPLKAAGATGYDIPFKGANTITQTHGTLWRGYSGAQLWIDDLAYAEGGPPPPAPTLVDAGFESGAEGTPLVSPPWAANGAPQHREYDAARAKTGSQSAWIQGPVTASNAGAYETASAGLSANGAETTFWLYLDTTSQSRLLDDYSPGVAGADRALGIQFASGGRVNVLTDHAGNPNGYATGAYTTVGSYESGWTQYRVVYTFTGAGGQTYTLSKRSSEADPWTPLKAAGATGYDIPFKGANTITQTHGTLWRGYYGAQLWLDDLAYAEGAAN